MVNKLPVHRFTAYEAHFLVQNEQVSAFSSAKSTKSVKSSKDD